MVSQGWVGELVEGWSGCGVDGALWGAGRGVWGVVSWVDEDFGEEDGVEEFLEAGWWTAISFVDGSEKLELWFRLPSWFSPIPDGLRSGYGTRSRNEAWSDCNRVQSMMSPL